MVIELRGVNMVNKGAELMMLSVISKLREELQNPSFVMEASKEAPRTKLLEYGIYTKKNFKKSKFPFKYLYAITPSFVLKRRHYIDAKKVQVVLDASGYAFGDTWGAKKASKRIGSHIAEWKKEGKKVILLPQAFGPFSDIDLASVMKVIIKHADLICIRDKVSHKYMEQLNGNSENFILAPDFTNLIKGIVPEYFDKSKCEVAIIVNKQMIDNTTNKDGEAYFYILPRIILMIADLGYKPYFLIHEGKMDISVAEEINKKLLVKLPIIQESNPLHVKGIISQSKAVITSRFHGLVSCLSQAIPCLATTWSHKYEALLKDYNFEQAMLDVHWEDDVLLEKLKLILTEPSRQIIIENLRIASSRQKERSEQMWKKVIDTINGKTNKFTNKTSKVTKKISKEMKKVTFS